MNIETKRCFCCNGELAKNERICPKCGAIQPVEINAAADKRKQKSLKWGVIIGVIVGVSASIFFGELSPNSYLFLLGILFGFGSVFLTVFCFEIYYKNKDANQTEKICREQSGARRWMAQEKIDKAILNQDSAFSNQMLAAISSVNSLWESHELIFKENDNPTFRSELYLSVITPELFIKNYYLFKSGNHDKIKDSIYAERPYLIIETIIKMGLYIFKTNNNIFVLEKIINSDRGEYIDSKISAQKILNEEMKKSFM